MKLRVRHYPRAQGDIDEALLWLDERNPRAAERLAGRFGEILQVLSERPLAGRARPEFLDGLRSFPVERYIVFYLTTPATLDIVRVLAAAQDMTPRDFDSIESSEQPQDEKGGPEPASSEHQP